MLGHARRHYDHRIRQAIVATGNPHLFPSLKIPRSTARTWIRRGSRRVVSVSDHHGDVAGLHGEIADLRAKARFYFVVACVLLAVIRATGVRLDSGRIPDGRNKADLLRAIMLGSRHVPLSRLLRLVGLTAPRFHAWKRREVRCELDDRPSCPRTRPSKLTAEEVQIIKSHVLDPAQRHMSIRALCFHAQRWGQVFASVTTWRRLIRERGWRRPRTRVYPVKPKYGVRGASPNTWWHIDLTVIRLLDGTKVYLHAIIDNFSRKILAWELAQRVCGETTTRILERAARFLDGREVNLMADSGVENVNHDVDALLEQSPIRRVLAQVEMSESNSMIEAFWRSLRHQWLYLHELDSIAKVKSLVAFYVEQHNCVMPHAAFDGRTPDEVYFGTGSSVAHELASGRAAARSSRLAVNHAHARRAPGHTPQVVQLQRGEFTMSGCVAGLAAPRSTGHRCPREPALTHPTTCPSWSMC